MADKNMEAQISVEFEEATSRQSLNSGETINTLWSKVKRWLSDLKAVAFSGSYIDLSDKPTTATTDNDGLMSASDKGKLDAFEITATGGKLHDKDIATTDLIPTSLPANGGNADTVDNKHYTDFSQNAVLLTIEQVNDPNMESGIYSAENVSMSFSSDVASNWFMLIVNKHRASAGYGTQIAIPYDNGEQRGTFYRICHAGNWGNWIRIADGGNADTVDNVHISCTNDAIPNSNWFAAFTDPNNLRAIDPGRAYVGNAGNAITANTVKTMSVIGTVSNATHNSVLEWANSISGFGTACVIDAYGYPSDLPVQQEGLITVETCYQKSRKIVTFTSYTDIGMVYQRSIWGNEWRYDWYQTKAGNADTLDGLHASDFVNANDRDQIQIPNNVDVPAWIYANGKRYKIYMTNGANIGMTNIPNDTTDYVWYWFDGINIIAREWAKGKYYICDVINGGFSGWKDIYTSGYKPYVTGEEGCGYIVTASVKDYQIFNFTPSAVICQIADGSAFLQQSYKMGLEYHYFQMLVKKY